MVVSLPANRTVKVGTDLDKVSRGYANKRKKTSPCFYACGVFVCGDMFNTKYLRIHEDRQTWVSGIYTVEKALNSAVSALREARNMSLKLHCSRSKDNWACIVALDGFRDLQFGVINDFLINVALGVWKNRILRTIRDKMKRFRQVVFFTLRVFWNFRVFAKLLRYVFWEILVKSGGSSGGNPEAPDDGAPSKAVQRAANIWLQAFCECFRSTVNRLIPFWRIVFSSSTVGTCVAYVSSKCQGPAFDQKNAFPSTC